jgi:type IV pilus assembly protein PilE
VYSKGKSSTSHERAVVKRQRDKSCTKGFTLLEVMIVTAIVAILAAIALPNYSEYIKRGKIIEATSALSDIRTRYEQFYLDNRTYAGGCANFGATVQASTKSFTIACSTGETAATYAPTATGNAAEGMSGFSYSINEQNQKSSTITASGWSGNSTCWAVRRDGSCG